MQACCLSVRTFELSAFHPAGGFFGFHPPFFAFGNKPAFLSDSAENP
jgi:hypothetical protein